MYPKKGQFCFKKSTPCLSDNIRETPSWEMKIDTLDPFKNENDFLNISRCLILIVCRLPWHPSPYWLCPIHVANTEPANKVCSISELVFWRIRRFCSAFLFPRCVCCCLWKSFVTFLTCKIPNLQSKTSSSVLLLTFTTHTQHEKREAGNAKSEFTGAIFFFHK